MDEYERNSADAMLDEYWAVTSHQPPSAPWNVGKTAAVLTKKSKMGISYAAVCLILVATLAISAGVSFTATQQMSWSLSTADRLAEQYAVVSKQLDGELYVVTQQDGKQGIMDKAGKPILPCRYQTIAVLGAERFCVTGTNAAGELRTVLVNRQGKVLCGERFDSITFEAEESGRFGRIGIARYADTGLVTVISQDGVTLPDLRLVYAAFLSADKVQGYDEQEKCRTISADKSGNPVILEDDAHLPASAEPQTNPSK